MGAITPSSRGAADKLLAELFDRYSEAFEAMQWPWEESRWQRLVYCLLAAEAEEWGPSSRADRATAVLVELDLVRVSRLAKADDSLRSDIHAVLRRTGFSDDSTSRIVRTLVRLAQLLIADYRGRIQRLLREVGATIVGDVKDRLHLHDELDDARADLVVTHWLQDVLNLPVLVPSPGLSAFSSETGLDRAAIEEEFDEHGLNVALADEMLGRWLLARTRSQGASEVSEEVVS